MGAVTGIGGFLAKGIPEIAALASVAGLLKMTMDTVLGNVTAEANLRAATHQAGGTQLLGVAGGIPAGIMSPIERMQYESKLMTIAPGLRENVSSITKFTGYMGYFGLNVEQSGKLLMESYNKQGLGSKQLMDIYRISNALNVDLGMSAADVNDTMLEMVDSLRRVGMSSKDATALLKAMPTKDELGMVSVEDMKALAKGVSGFLGSMKPSTMAGLMMFTHGGGLPTTNELFKANPGELLTETYGKVKSGFGGRAEDMKAYISEGFMKSMGVGVRSDLKGTIDFDKMITTFKSTQAIADELIAKGQADTDTMVDKGLKILTEQKGLLEIITNVMTEFMMPLARTMAPVLRKTEELASAFGNMPKGLVGKMSTDTDTTKYSHSRLLGSKDISPIYGRQ